MTGRIIIIVVDTIMADITVTVIIIIMVTVTMEDTTIITATVTTTDDATGRKWDVMVTIKTGISTAIGIGIEEAATVTEPNTMMVTEAIPVAVISHLIVAEETVIREGILHVIQKDTEILLSKHI
jgi:hypothetical protein